MKLLLCGAHPAGCDARGKAVHALVGGLTVDHGWKVDVCTFQRPADVRDTDRHRRPVADVRTLADRGTLCTQIARWRPDVVLLYDHLAAVADLLTGLEGWGVPVVAYVHTAHAGMKPAHVEALNRCAAVAVYSPFWARQAVSAGVTAPVHHVAPGVDADLVYPAPQDVARAVYRIDRGHFVALNVSRNAVSKRWDVCMAAWAAVVADFRRRCPVAESRRPVAAGRFPMLLIAANMTGAWDLMYLYAEALKRHGVAFDVGLEHITHIDGKHTLSDFQVNVLYNAADVGICVGDGSAAGTCAKEHSSVGRPIVASRVPGHVDALREDAVLFVDPVAEVCIEAGRPDSGCFAGVVSADAVARAVLRLMAEPEVAAGMSAAALYHGDWDWAGPCCQMARVLRRAAAGPAGR